MKVNLFTNIQPYTFMPMYSQDEEEEVDERAPSMGAKSLCRPFEQPTENPIVPGVTKCAACDHDAKHFMLFGRSY
jgi:prolyl-tRNA synthetase